MEYLKIDIGCGGNKRTGFIGLDYQDGPGVDHVIDVTQERFPFDDDSVDHVFSSHFLEHIDNPNHIFQEVARVCCDKATIEIWTPYAFSNEAFLYGHSVFFTEEPWFHFCYSQRDFHLGILKGRWLLKQLNYVVAPEVEDEIVQNGFTMGFAVKYFKGVVREFGVEIEYREDLDVPPVLPVRTYSHTRDGSRFTM